MTKTRALGWSGLVAALAALVAGLAVWAASSSADAGKGPTGADPASELTGVQLEVQETPTDPAPDQGGPDREGDGRRDGNCPEQNGGGDGGDGGSGSPRTTAV
jgi:hypothetical protein